MIRRKRAISYKCCCLVYRIGEDDLADRDPTDHHDSKASRVGAGPLFVHKFQIKKKIFW